MTSRCDEGKEFVQWLQEWRSKIGSQVSLEPIHPEKEEDENESGPDKDLISRRKGLISEPRMATKPIRVAGRFEYH
jgi:hypothetical protein